MTDSSVDRSGRDILPRARALPTVARMELSQVRLLVRDFPRVYRFYRDVLDCVPQRDDENGPYAKLTPRGDSSAAIALQSRTDFARIVGSIDDAGVGVNAIVVLKVEDLEALAATLATRGTDILQPVQVVWGRMKVAHLRDPEGNVVELQQWL